ncbi:hypothetical protein FQP34_05040 [Peribacillus simplex]|uniref:Aspartate ammonia-lyase n=1 Tax=Peribacillus simplex TaxID=1478 RepID=A0A8B5Y2B2_9BACI|nr:hypothetical protein [Peribacillus simplex]TVX82948.1 hypothetical protein FQP34_05040 [Peribacillus simplex]
MSTIHINHNVRIEKDFLGSKQVPVHAYYGIQTLRAVENFPITGYPYEMTNPGISGAELFDRS